MMGAVASGIVPSLIRRASIILTVSGVSGALMALPVLAWSSTRLMPLPSALGWKVSQVKDRISPNGRGG